MIEETYKGWDPEGITFRIKTSASIAVRVFGAYFDVTRSALQDNLSKTK